MTDKRGAGAARASAFARPGTLATGAIPCRRRCATGALALAGLYAFATGALAFDLQGHRGARGLAPENTLAAFRTALAIGVTTLETDLAVTKDGVLVVSHDPHLDPDLVRGPDGAWIRGPGAAIHSLTRAELARYDIGRTNPASQYAKSFPGQKAADGQRFPTLDQVFALGATTPVRFNLETKITPTSGNDTVDPATFAKLVADAVRTAGMTSRVTVQSFDWRTLVALKTIAPGIPTACLTMETASNDTVQRNSAAPSPWHAGLALATHNGSVPKLAKAAGCSTWSPFWRNVTPEAIAEAHAAGMKVVPWTVNDPAEMGKLVDMRVDGIITDYPDRLREVLAAKGITPE